jgi:hypothetical protein
VGVGKGQWTEEQRKIPRLQGYTCGRHAGGAGRGGGVGTRGEREGEREPCQGRGMEY